MNWAQKMELELVLGAGVMTWALEAGAGSWFHELGPGLGLGARARGWGRELKP